MAEMRCYLDWNERWPKLVIAVETELTEVQVKELAQAICQAATNKLACLLECGGGCPKEENEDGPGTGSAGNRPTQH